MGKRTELLAAVQFLWELVRFLGLFALVGLRFQGSFVQEPAAVLWLVALGSAQLLVPALLALFLHSPDRRDALLPFLRLAKILQVFPVLLLALALAYRPGPALPWLPLASPRLTLSAGLVAGSLVDLLFLLLLSLPSASGMAAGRAPGEAAGRAPGAAANSTAPGEASEPPEAPREEG
jgi:hypothetical protein